VDVLPLEHVHVFCCPGKVPLPGSPVGFTAPGGITAVMLPVSPATPSTPSFPSPASSDTRANVTFALAFTKAATPEPPLSVASALANVMSETTTAAVTPLISSAWPVSCGATFPLLPS
jgi:hypothetical protein